ncbi:alcohol dehydrogenase catalytic domain-containing protein [Paracoccus stylophorae]|nr:zinc-binding dehydrogenase [Paracoccus stylophorae]
MAGVLLKGHGGLDRLEYRTDIPVPMPGEGEVLVRVTATAKNNTDRKVREGLYSTERDDHVTSFQLGEEPTLRFPRIQGADVVGRVAATGAGVDSARMGDRGLLDFNIYADAREHLNLVPDYVGHGRDGGFADYVVVPSAQFHTIARPDLADAELATLGMCSYQTAFRMLNAARIAAGEHVLVTGASGGVGTALIQLCRLLGAVPHAVSSPGKDEALVALGAETVIDRSRVTDWPKAVDKATGGVVIDAVMDLVGGALTNPLVDVMTRRMSARTSYPRLSIAGASAGNVTEILWTKIYLNQVQIFGVSHGTRAEADRLVGWIRAGALQPVLHRTFRLSDIHAAERCFMDRDSDFIGKIVLVPDGEWQQHGAPFADTGGGR